jgi:hypothetical protein
MPVGQDVESSDVHALICRDLHAELAPRIGPGLGLGLVFPARHDRSGIVDDQDIAERLAGVVDHRARDRDRPVVWGLGENDRRQHKTQKRQHRAVLFDRRRFVYTAPGRCRH